MRLARALELPHNFVSTPDSLEGLDSLLDPSLVEQAYAHAERLTHKPLPEHPGGQLTLGARQESLDSSG